MSRAGKKKTIKHGMGNIPIEDKAQPWQIGSQGLKDNN
jgi:hypothetical protein